MPTNHIDNFVDAYVEALLDQNAAVFAGAGLSIPAGAVNWKDLMRSIAREVGLDVDRENDLIEVAQFHLNERGGRDRINRALVTKFSELAAPTENHEILASLPIETYWTTNYDTLIEDALRKVGRKPDVKISAENLPNTLPRRGAVVYKMHGDVSQPHDAVVTKDDFEAYNLTTRQLFSTALQGDLITKTFLFIGFSFTDPNLTYVLSRIRVLLGQNHGTHYCLLRRVHRKDFKRTADFQYASARQDLQVRDLRRYGIIGVLVDDYLQYTDILRRIQRRYSLSHVFVSGSAAEYSPWDVIDAEQMMQTLGQRLIQAGFVVVSGFGLGVGSYILNGVLAGIEAEGATVINNRVVLRPFPQGIRDPATRKRRWTAYRKEMISHAGVTVFLFGNKLGPSGTVLLADGLEEEFEISKERGVTVVPIGCTGYKAAEFHEKIMKDFESYYPGQPKLKTSFAALARKDTNEVVVDRIMTFLTRLREEA